MLVSRCSHHLFIQLINQFILQNLMALAYTNQIKGELEIPEWIVKQFQFYIPLTSDGKDLEFLQSLTDVLATNAKKADTPFHNCDLIRAIGLIFHLFIKSELQLADELLNGCPNSEQQKWLLQYLISAVCSLDKRDVNMHLTYFLKHANLPTQVVNEYNINELLIVGYMSDLQNWIKNVDSKLGNKVNYVYLTSISPWQPIKQNTIYVYSEKGLPCLVLLPYKDWEELVEDMIASHRSFVEKLILQILLDQNSKPLSGVQGYIAAQPYRFGTVEEFINVLTFSNPGLLGCSIQQIQQSEAIKSFFNGLISQGATGDSIRTQIATQTKHVDVQVKQQQVQSQEVLDNVFATQQPVKQGDDQKARFKTNIG